MEKKILRIKPMGEILKSLSTTSDDIFLVAVSREMANITEFADGVDLIEVGSLKREIFQELDKAREEGREESKREYAQAIATGQKVELTEELVDRIWSANLEEMYKMGLTKLLKTKEDGK